MIELKRLKLINWHNFENVTFDCARLTYMIGVNAVGKTTILDAIRYCLTTNRNFNALGNKKSGRTLQGSVHAKQRGENAYRRPGHTVAYIGAEFWDSVKRTPFVIAVRVESEGPMQELHPGDQTWYLSEDGCTLEQLPFIDPKTGVPSAKEDFKPATGRLSYTRSPSEARDRICRALGIGRASSPLGKKFNEVFQMGTSMDEIPNFREFLYQYILPQPELDLDALQGDRLELENLHAVLAEAQTRADALEEIVDFGREAAEKQTQTLVNRGAALLARAAADGSEQTVWQEHLDAGRRQLEQLNARYAEAKNAEAEARRAYLSAHGAASASGEGRALDALTEELSRRKTALDTAARKAEKAESALARTQSLLAVLRRSGFAAGIKAEELNVLIGSDAVEDADIKEAVKLNTLMLLHEKYGITERDFTRAEIEVVPAHKARDVGFDRSMVGGYGHDDRVDAYPALMAEIETKDPVHTTVCVLTDKEEIGSDGVTGMQSMYVFHFMQLLCRAAGQDDILAFQNSVCLSADVTAAYDPSWANAFEPQNGTYAGRGVAFFKYTGSRGKSSASDASAELVGNITRLLDANGVAWQIGELGRLDLGGGGTIAKYVANRGIPVLDIGVPVLSMHSPFEVIHKTDLYMAYRTFALFCQNADE